MNRAPSSGHRRARTTRSLGASAAALLVAALVLPTGAAVAADAPAEPAVPAAVAAPTPTGDVPSADVPSADLPSADVPSAPDTAAPASTDGVADASPTPRALIHISEPTRLLRRSGK
ncbi:hypothetical protein AB6N23_18055, partial [Cellulomonas sp. 179-A 9B4 NHS]